MIFVETKTKDGYTYDAHNVIGKIHIEAVEKLDGEILDGMVGLMLRKNLNAETIKGTVEYEEGKTVSYTLEKESQWQESTPEEDASWNNSPTSTKRQEKESTPRNAWKTKILNWLLKYVDKFRQALQKKLSTQK